MKVLIIGILTFLVCSTSGDEHGREQKERQVDGTKKKEERAALTEPVVGHWNVTNGFGKYSELCIRMDAGIRLDVEYETKFGNKSTATIFSDDDTVVDNEKSICKNASTDQDETMVLDFNKGRSLQFHFTRNSNATGDKSGQKWQLVGIRFDFILDPVTFPDAKLDQPTFKENNDLKDIVSPGGRSYGCTNTDALKVTDGFTVTMNSLRVQPFMTSEEFSQAEWCAKEQTSDLIPIIIGAALAALVIIVLIAYLIGRARARTTTYDNI